MNREIKFRGKRVDNGEWVYGNLSIEYDGTTFISFWGSVLLEPENNYKEMMSFSFDVNPDTIGQYTGLKDKEWKEIYEGDIMGGYPHGSAHVSYNEEYACFESRNIDADLEDVNGLFANDLKDCFNEWSVIGNIHDNPELINE